VYERGRAYLGEFGIGKSVLINKVAAEAGQAGHWVARRVRVAQRGDALALLAETLRDLSAGHGLDARIGRRLGGLLERVEEVVLPVVGGGLRTRARSEPPNRHRVVTDLLVELATLARESTTADLPDGRLVLIRIDEVQNTADPLLSQLLTAIGDALDETTAERDAAGIDRRRLLPIAVYLSGLPDFGALAARAGATFSRRFKTEELGALSEPDLRIALRPFTTEGWPLPAGAGYDRVHMAPDAVDLIVAQCLGDPFLFQLAGEAAWNAGTGAVISGEEARRGWQSVRREVIRYANARLEGLTDLQMRYLEAVAALDPQERTAAEVAHRLGRERSRELASTAQSLDVDHRLIRRTAGRIRFRSDVVAACLAGDWP
jgi:hypothetical protein